ncbi:MAG TPA: zinc-ribbon domain-containing protein [Gemmatimonadaceae bacterium]|nr:zinc-ribbon domain-containing protein [Gemmatimonadaceae bacterium]
MNVSCPECRSVFRVDPSKIPTAGVRARCSVCGGVITIGKGGAIENDFSDGRAAATPAARPAPRQQPPPAPRPPTPAAPTPGVAPFARNTPLTGSRPVTPHVPAPAAPRPSAPVIPAPAPRPSAPNVPAGGRAPAQPTSPPRPQPAATPVAPSAPTPRVPMPAQAAPSAPPASSAPSAPSAPSRSINPFLSNDPNVKAKRLARALVSDIVAYFPQKREEGLRNGTLKQLFREEIKKSYEEYVDQMGKDFAETTTHFQDALNEVLAGGKKLF